MEARLTIEDPATGRTTEVLSIKAGDIVTAATDLARRLSPRATRYETTNPEAVRGYTMAMESGSLPLRIENAEAAIAADPNFGSSYLVLAELKAQQQDGNGALAALDRAMARGNAIDAPDRARIELMAARLRSDVGAQEHALGELAKANPGDAETLRVLGQTAYVRHDYAQAVEAYQKALRILPNDVNLLNLIAYAQAFAGDLNGALASLRRCQSLRPAEANPMDSMGDIQLMYGHLREAEDLYLQTDKKDRKLLGGGDLLKAAFARLMTGDVPGASTMAQQYLEARTAMKDPGVPVLAAEWLFVCGNRQAGEERLRAFAQAAEAAQQKDAASIAYIKLAVWSLAMGDRPAAAQLSFKAATLAASPASSTDALVVRFLSQPSASAAEWNARAEKVFHNAPQSGIRNLTLGYALVFDGQFQAATPVLKQVYQSQDTDPGLPVLLAWSLMETGHENEAAPLLRFNPIPPFNGIGLYTPFYFPRMYDLRSRLAAKAGRQDEARANREVFGKLGGKTN